MLLQNGCQFCRKRHLVARPAARWKPDDGRPQQVRRLLLQCDCAPAQLPGSAEPRAACTMIWLTQFLRIL